MKNKLALSVILLLAGTCTFLGQQPAPNAYYPLNVGDRWTYRVIDLKTPAAKADGKKKVVVEVERQENFVRKIEKDAKGATETKVGYILKSTSGGKTTRDHVAFLEDGVYRIHSADTPISPPLLFFKYPLVKGMNGAPVPWESNSVSGNITIKGTFSWKLERVTVPYGQADAVVVSFTNGLANEKLVEIDYWFAPNVGMVKQRVREKNREIALELEKYERPK